MRKIIFIVFIIVYSTSYAQNKNIRATELKSKYENIFYRSPQKFNNQEQKYIVNKITFSSSYVGSKSKNFYQISFYGKVNNKKEQIVFNAKSIEELDYYSRLFKGKYTKILLVQNSYIVASKKHYDTSISVEH